ncbi:MAG: hypothetical protein WC285_05805, partial [Candidatus Gracilibacteria bacterium]
KKTDEKITDQNRVMKPEKFGKETAEESANQVANQEANQWAVKLEMALCREKVAQKSVTGDTFGSENHHPQSEAKVTETGTKTGTTPKISLYIQAFKKRQTITQASGKCSYPNCNSQKFAQ